MNANSFIKIQSATIFLCIVYSTQCTSTLCTGPAKDIDKAKFKIKCSTAAGPESLVNYFQKGALLGQKVALNLRYQYQSYLD